MITGRSTIKPTLPFGAYLTRFLQLVSVDMMEGWKKEFLGGRKVSKLTDLMNKAQQSGDEVDTYTALDYIAAVSSFSLSLIFF